MLPTLWNLSYHVSSSYYDKSLLSTLSASSFYPAGDYHGFPPTTFRMKSSSIEWGGNPYKSALAASTAQLLELSAGFWMLDHPPHYRQQKHTTSSGDSATG